MLLALIVWAYLLFITLIYGMSLIHFLSNAMQLGKVDIPSLPILVIVGLNLMAWLGSVFSLVMRLSLFAHLLVLMGACILTISLREEPKGFLVTSLQSKGRIFWLMVAFGTISILLYTVKVPSNPDTPLYHAQAIHWTEDYPVVPGLGNLDPRQGSSSSWFVLNALFSFSFFHSQSFHLISSFLFLVCMIYFLGGLQNLFMGVWSLENIVRAAFIPFMFYTLIDEVSSPGTDLPVILQYWVVLCLWLGTLKKDGLSSYRLPVVFFLSISIVTFKISGILVLLIALWIFIEQFRLRNYRACYVLTGMAVCVFLPWLVRNFILSGYWVYPEPLARWISPHVDWAIPLERVASFREGVRSWAFSNGSREDGLAGLSLIGQFKLWFSGLTSNRKGMVILALLSPVLGLVLMLLPSLKKNIKYYFLIMMTCFVCTLFWLFTAPNFRFGYGYLLGSIVIACAPAILLTVETLKGHRQYLVVVLLLFLSIQQVNILLNAPRDGTSYSDLFIMPADYPQVATVACDLGNTSIRCARNWRLCGYHAFPCLPRPIQNVQLRGNTLRDGFRHMPPSNN